MSGALRRRDGCDPLELVKAFEDRIYSIAKHITQNDEDAEDGLIQAFLEVCPDLDGCLDGDGLASARDGRCKRGIL